MKNFEIGQLVRVIGDSFTADPHGLEIGTIAEVHSISPATKFKDFPPLVQLMVISTGAEPTDLPERVHVKTGDGALEYANIVFEDLELVDEEEIEELDDWEEFEDEDFDYESYGEYIRMNEDDWIGDYSEGDVFEVLYNKEGEALFIDNAGDERFLEDHEGEYEFVDSAEI
jgi:hypothetical protein